MTAGKITFRRHTWDEALAELHAEATEAYREYVRLREQADQCYERRCEHGPYSPKTGKPDRRRKCEQGWDRDHFAANRLSHEWGAVWDALARIGIPVDRDDQEVKRQ